MHFALDRWYSVRVRVTSEKIEAWIDDKKVVDVATRGRAISVRPEVALSRPLGVACFATTSGLREIKLRTLNRSLPPAKAR
jgi:hypothetical protein